MKEFLPFIWGRRDSTEPPTWEELCIILNEVSVIMEELEELGFVCLFDLSTNHLIIRKEVVL